MFKAFKFRIYPNQDQKVLIKKHFGATRFVYNHFLNYRQTEYTVNGNKVSYITTQAELTKMKKLECYSWLREVGSQSLQMAIRNLDMAYSRFFKKLGSYPTYKSRKAPKQSFTVPQNTKLIEDRLFIPKFIKTGIKVKVHRNVPEDKVIKQATISLHNGQYFVSLLIDDGVSIPKQSKSTTSVGLDVGLTSLVVTSDGKKYENKHYFEKSQSKLAFYQRQLAKKAKGSNNRRKQLNKIQKVHTKIRNQRHDYLNKISNEITNCYGIICIETLSVKSMLKNKYLAKGISDASWGEFLRQLEYKSLWKGKTFLKIDQWFPSSQLCSHCGANTGKKPLSVRTFTCPTCGTKDIDRDINASINIRNYALGQLDRRNTAGTAEI